MTYTATYTQAIPYQKNFRCSLLSHRHIRPVLLKGRRGFIIDGTTSCNCMYDFAVQVKDGRQHRPPLRPSCNKHPKTEVARSARPLYDFRADSVFQAASRGKMSSVAQQLSCSCHAKALSRFAAHILSKIGGSLVCSICLI